MNRPNILLLTIDTLRADMLGCYGHVGGLTPSLDRFAAQGIQFNQAITGGSWTQAAFPVLLTSTAASMYGGCLGPLSPERPSPIEWLAAHGYRTGGFSTSPLLGRVYGYQRGFQDFVELLPQEKEPFLRKVRGGQRILRLPLTHRLLRLMGRQARPARQYVSAAEVNEALYHWLDRRQSPFFAWVHYMDVHWPYHLQEKLVHPDEVAQTWKDLALLHEVNWLGQSLTPSQRNHYIQLYERAVQYVDEQIGQLLKFLHDAGHAEDTVVIIVADHGEEFLEHGHWGHVETNLHDEIIRVPLLIRLPKNKRNGVVNQQVRTLDLMPTILELCGYPLLEGMQGSSLAPLWGDEGVALDGRIAISERWRNRGDISHLIAARSRTHKLIYDVYQPDQPRFYDLEADPGETRNMVDSHAQITSELHEHVQRHLQQATQATGQSPNQEPLLDRALAERLRNLGYLR